MTDRQVFSPHVLRASALACGRGGIVLADGLDFAVGAGKALVLHGANGTGKSTVLMTLAGQVAPLAGAVDVEGAGDAPAIHYCGHRNAVKARLGVEENLQFWADVNGPTGLAPEAALAAVGLAALARLDAGYLSAGQTRRLALARLLVSLRPIWLLDEPTAALDQAGQGLVGRLIDQHLDAGGLAVVATHDPIAITNPGRVTTLTLGGAA